MDAQNIDPIDDLLSEIAIERQHLTRMSSVDVRDELAFRLYPLLARVVETLAERIDIADDDGVADEAHVPRELAGRIVLLLGKFIDALTKAAPEQAAALTDEAKQIVGELVQIYAPDETFDTAPAQIPAEAQPEEPNHG
jgi:hypothetical protein